MSKAVRAFAYEGKEKSSQESIRVRGEAKEKARTTKEDFEEAVGELAIARLCLEKEDAIN